MNKNDVINLIEDFAPLELQEAWDNSGWQIELEPAEIKKILLAVTVTEEIVNQAVNNGCDLIISHHPLFYIPFSLNKNISIYSAHTNLDSTDGGTTDTLISLLGFSHVQKIDDFLRFVELNTEISLSDLVNLLKKKLELGTIRVVNNSNKKTVKKLAFCSGSGADFLQDAEKIKADVLITGDLKYHTAIDSNIMLIDAGHYETEKPVLKTIENLLKPLNIEVMTADEKSPFINY